MSSTEFPKEPRKFKNPTTIEEMNEMRAQLKKDQQLKRRVKIEYKKKVQIESQGMEYSPPSDLKQFKILKPKSLPESDDGNVIPVGSLPTINDTSTKDISDQIFVGEEKEEK